MARKGKVWFVFIVVFLGFVCLVLLFPSAQRKLCLKMFQLE